MHAQLKVLLILYSYILILINDVCQLACKGRLYIASWLKYGGKKTKVNCLKTLLLKVILIACMLAYNIVQPLHVDWSI